LNIDGFQEDDDFDEDDEDINDMDYDNDETYNLDLAPALGQFDNEMANVDVGADDMEVFNAEWNKISAQHQQQPNKRSYINQNIILSDQYVQESGSP